METKNVLSEQDTELLAEYLEKSQIYLTSKNLLRSYGYFNQPFTSHHPCPEQLWLNGVNFAWRLRERNLDTEQNAILVTKAYNCDKLAQYMLLTWANYVATGCKFTNMSGAIHPQDAKLAVENICECLEQEQDPYYLEDLDDPTGQHDGFYINLKKGTVKLGKDQDLHRVTVRMMKLMHLKQIYDFTSKELKF